LPSALLALALAMSACAQLPAHTATPNPASLLPPSPVPAPYPPPLAGRAVFTYYFYWYDSKTGGHLAPYGEQAGNSLTDHPAGEPPPNWRRSAWHLQQLRDMVYAGIDVLLPVFWADQPDWSEGGIQSLAEALEELRLSGTTPPAVGMFYDTTPLRGMDLRTQEARDYVYDGVRFFFSTIPRQYWALAEGDRPIIWFYSGQLPVDYDKRLFNDLHQRFEEDFGLRPYLVMNADWNCGKLPNEGKGFCDATYSWGGAISATFSPNIASISPGYDERGLPDRDKRLHIDRADGVTYRNAFVKAMRCNAPWLAVETWNEFHEGTDIAESQEYGRRYLDLTREFTGYFKSGTLPSGMGIETAYSTSPFVESTAGSHTDRGLGPGPSLADGQYAHVTLDEVAALQTVALTPKAEASYLYYQMDDGFYFADAQKITLSVEYLDQGREPIYLEYDAAPCGSAADDADVYKQVLLAERKNTGKWQAASLDLTDATFVNNQNFGADFRLSTGKTPLTLSSVRVDKSGPEPTSLLVPSVLRAGWW
jgi:Domain of unknown function (DUF5010)